MRTPEQTVQLQLDAYNAKDLALFLSAYSDDIQITRLPQTTPSITGKAALGQHYAQNRFNRPDLHAKLLNRMVIGNKVIDHEWITGLSAQPMQVAAAYEVKDGLISQAWFISAE